MKIAYKTSFFDSDPLYQTLENVFPMKKRMKYLSPCALK